MEQIKTFSECIDELLVLGSIFTQINLCLAVAWVLVVLAALQEVLVLLVLVLVDDRHTQFLSQFPTSFIVRILRV